MWSAPAPAICDIPRVMIFLFDIDGTLLLSGGAGRDALARAMDRLLPVAGAMDTVVCAGKTDLAIVEEACRAALGRIPDDSVIQQVLDTYIELLPVELERNPSFRLMPGIPDTLHALRRRKNSWLAVGTGNIEAGARIKLRRAGLDKVFPVGGYGDGCRHRIDILNRALGAVKERAGALDPGPAIVIGDTVRDIEAAHQLGLPVAVLGGITTSIDDLAEAGADHIMEDMEELLPWSRKLAIRDRKSAR